MNGFSNWRDRLPLPVFFALVFVVWTGIQLLVRAGDGGGVSGPTVVIYVVGGFVLAAVLTGLMAWRRSRSGGARSFADMNAAVRTGHLPENAEPSVWEPELARRERSFLIGRWLNPVVFGLFAVLAIVLLVTGGGVLISLVCLVLFIAIGVASSVLNTRYLARVHSLRAQLRVGTPAPGTGPGTGHL